MKKKPGPHQQLILKPMYTPKAYRTSMPENYIKTSYIRSDGVPVTVFKSTLELGLQDESLSLDWKWPVKLPNKRKKAPKRRRKVSTLV